VNRNDISNNHNTIMKTNLINITLIVAIPLIFASCQKDTTTPDPTPTPTPCNYIQWTGNGSCNAGYYPTIDNLCGPNGFPFTFHGSTSAYTTCEGATSIANGAQVYRYNDGGSGGCNYSNFNGYANCASDKVAVTSSLCCPSSKPYYCANTNGCYTSCSDAAISCNGSVIHGINSGSSSSGGCNYSDFNGYANCASDKVAVTSSLCCPSSKPYYCANTNGCYASCSDAATSCNGSVIHGINSGSSSSGGCNYSNFNGYANCASDKVAVTSTLCCPSSKPYYCANANLCYPACSDAATSCNGSVIHGINSGSSSSSGGSSTVTFWMRYQCNCAPISVYVNNSYIGGITGYYENGFPGCNAAGCASTTISGTNNTWHATGQGGHAWPAAGTGSLTISPGGCGDMELL
jgi:hypothetical protein